MPQLQDVLLDLVGDAWLGEVGAVAITDEGVAPGRGVYSAGQGQEQAGQEQGERVFL